MAMMDIIENRTPLGFPYWSPVLRHFSPDSSFFASGNIERELLAKQAPGPDDFSMALFQNCWDVVKGDLMRVFGEFFESGEVNLCTNATFICLISKKEKSVKIGDFRPISLVTSLYKILGKVLSERIRDVLGETISASQGAFVHERQILDMALVANEVVEEYRALHKEGVVFKVDFEKAYDYVDWDFLDFVLERKGFDFKWRKWVWGCVSSCNMSVIVNGKAKNSFHASRGLRQGDPLSPFLFIVVVDVLGRLIDVARDKGVTEGIVVGRDMISVTHLQFADDTIFFSSKEESMVCNLLMLLRIFEVVSSLKVNLTKSCVGY